MWKSNVYSQVTVDYISVCDSLRKTKNKKIHDIISNYQSILKNEDRLAYLFIFDFKVLSVYEFGKQNDETWLISFFFIYLSVWKIQV